MRSLGKAWHLVGAPSTAVAVLIDADLRRTGARERSTPHHCPADNLPCSWWDAGGSEAWWVRGAVRGCVRGPCCGHTCRRTDPTPGRGRAAPSFTRDVT